MPDPYNALIGMDPPSYREFSRIRRLRHAKPASEWEAEMTAWFLSWVNSQLEIVLPAPIRPRVIGASVNLMAHIPGEHQDRDWGPFFLWSITLTPADGENTYELAVIDAVDSKL